MDPNTGNTPENTDDTPIWDQQGLEKRVRGKQDRMVKLIQLFLADMPDRMSQLAVQIQDVNMQEARDTAHTIKGVAGNLGVMRLQTAAAELEDAVRSKLNDQMSCLLPVVTTEYEKSAVLLQNFVDAHPPQ